MTSVDYLDDGGPLYPELGPGVAKFRRMASGGIAGMDPKLRRAYGEAVETAIKSKQRSDLLRDGPAPAPIVKDVGAYIRANQRSALAAHPSQVRRRRTPDQWREMYEEVMNANKAGKQGAVPEKLERDPGPNPKARRARRK